MQKVAAEFMDKVCIIWKSFLLRPVPDPRVTFNDFRRDAWIQANTREPTCEFRLWETNEQYPNSSLPSLLAAKAASNQGTELFKRYHHSLFRALFTKNRNISDINVLLNLAECCGLDTLKLGEDMNDPKAHNSVIAEHSEAKDRGLKAVPATAIDGFQPIIGAVGLAEYRHAIQQQLTAN